MFLNVIFCGFDNVVNNIEIALTVILKNVPFLALNKFFFFN